MPINFQCPSCGMQMVVADSYAGQSGPCRQCGQMVVIPHPAGAPPMQVFMPASSTPNPYLPAHRENTPYVRGTCPRCGSRTIYPGPWPWYLGTLGAIFVSAKCCGQCQHEFDARKPHADLKRRKIVLAIVINAIGAIGIILVILMVALVAIMNRP